MQSLGNLSNNMTKLIRYEEKRIKQMQSEIKNSLRLSAQFMNGLRERAENHRNILN